MYENDPNRNAAGEYHYVGIPVMPGEQFNAGVTPHDDVFTAALRVRNSRVARGLDEFTGLPVDGRPFIGGHYPGYAPADESQVGAVLWGVFKPVVLWPAILVATVVALLVGAAWADKLWRDSAPRRGVVAQTLHEVAPAVSLAPPSAYLSPKQLAQARSLDAVLRGPPLQPPTSVDGYSAYLCQLQPACARAAEAQVGTLIAWRAELFLLAMARQGKPHAALDACLLPLATGVRIHPLLMARRACDQAALLRPQEAGSTSKALRESAWADVARVIEVVSFAACLDEGVGTCRLASAPDKLSRAFDIANESH